MTRHDLDTLNAIHAHRRSGQQIYDAQQEAFNVTTITNRFYDEYRYHYELARDAATNYNKGVPEFQNEDQTDKLHAFVQRLLGRLMFLYLGFVPSFSFTSQFESLLSMSTLFRGK